MNIIIKSLKTKVNDRGLFLCFSFLVGTIIYAQDAILPLWPKDRIPNHVTSDEREEHVQGDDLLRIGKVQEPTIEVYLPAKRNANGQAMLIFPGGGYHILAYDWEGTDIAKFLNGKGIAGIVVKYRLPSSVSQVDSHLVPLIDAQRSLRMVRSKAKEFNIKEDKIGVIGFSAGGHLVATLGTHYKEKVYKSLDPIDSLSARPNFMALGYPYISVRKQNKSNGDQKNPPDKNSRTKPTITEFFTLTERVTSDTPPAFLFHAINDPGVPVENSLVFFEALREKGVPTTMHIYPTGGHGFSLARENHHVRGWTERLFEWMESLD